MRGAIAGIKWETSHGVKLNNSEAKALTDPEVQDDPLVCSSSTTSKLIHVRIKHIQG